MTTVAQWQQQTCVFVCHPLADCFPLKALTEMRFVFKQKTIKEYQGCAP